MAEPGADQSEGPPPAHLVHHGHRFVALYLFILVLAAAVGATYGWQHHKLVAADKQIASLNAQIADLKKPAATSTPTTTDPTANWTPYSDKTAQFSLKYPATWSHVACDSLLLLGPTAATTGHCQSDSIGQMFVTSVAGDKRSTYELDASNYSNISKQTVTVNGTSSQKESGTYSSAPGAALGPASGTKVVVYIFYLNGRTYAAKYQQDPAAPDVLSDFDLMVTKTLKFSS